MRKQFTCAYGHHWEVTLDGEFSAAVKCIVCPVCGAAAETEQGTPSGPLQGMEGVKHDDLMPELAEELAQCSAAELAARDAPTVPKSPPPPRSSDGDPQETHDGGDAIPFADSVELGAVGLGELARGTLLKERYLLEKVLGRGGMGQVYLARDQVLHRPVAVKLIRPRDPGLRYRTIYEAGLREAFAEEARIGANLMHPAIATVLDFGFHDEEPFIVFEYIQGETLRQLLSRRGRLPSEDVRLILGPLAQALDFAHSHHVVHRDLKPENLRATLQGHFKILDLGLAKEFRHAVDWRSFAGTPLYAAPEQIEGLPCDGRTDQYALALITHEMITGHKVFEHAQWKEGKLHRSPEDPSPQRFLPELPDTVCAALARALEKQPNRRFTTCEEFAIAIGCQLLSAPVPPAEIFRLTSVRRMFGHWRSPSFALIQRTPVYLALAGDALWVSYRGELRQWPLKAITNIRREGWWGKKIHLRIQDGQKMVRQSFYFFTSTDCGQWYEQLQTLKQQLPASASEQIDPPQVEPVMMRQRPAIRYQSLGAVEYKDGLRRRAEVGLQLRAAMMRADAVIDVHEERLPGFRRTVWRQSGMAIRAVDSAGRLELRSRWFAKQVSQISLRMLLVVGIFFVGTLLHSTVLAVGLILSWPLTIVLLMRWLLWPQLLRPATITVLALGTMPLLSLMGSIIAVAATGKWQGMVGGLLDLTDLGIIVFSWFVCRRAWRAYSQYRSLVPDAEIHLPSLRRVSKGLTMVISLIFGVVLWGLAGWGGYSFVRDFALPGSDDWTEWRARTYIEDGRAKMGREPLQAEQDFRHGLKLWQQLTQRAPSRAEYLHGLAATYHHLGFVLHQTGKVAEAEQAYRQALVHYDKLETDFPAYQAPKADRESVQQTLTQLTIWKPFLDDNSEHEEGQQLQAAGQYQEAARIYREALERHESRKHEFKNESTNLCLLTSKEHRLARFLASCPDVQIRKPTEAVELARRAAHRDALKIDGQLAQDFPAMPQYRQELATILYSQGFLLHGLGKRADAETAYRNALQIRTLLTKEFPAVPDYQNELAETLVNLAILVRSGKDPAQARQLLEQAVPHHQAAVKANGRNPRYRDFFRANRQVLGETLLDLGDHRAAADAAGQLIQAAVDPANDVYNAACFLARCVPLAEGDSKLTMTQRQECAQAYADRAMATLRQAVQNGYKDAAHMKKDTDLGPLRSREDFQKLLQELEAKAQPERK